MTDLDPIAQAATDYDVAVIGAGPSGLAAATELMRLGGYKVIVLDREREAGGVPRHCGHPPFGMREFKRCLTGPAYARTLVEIARNTGARLATETSVVEIRQGPALTISTTHGTSEITARKIILATGVRETPRAPRLVSGQRPLGITTTGALQSMVYLNGQTPFRRPVIVGTELVSYSALLTCRHACIRPLAMLEQGSRPTARSYSSLLPRMLGVPARFNTRINRILGKQRVEGVETVDAQGKLDIIECDGIVFSGQFIPEASLLRASHLKLDPASGGPVIDQYGRCSDADYFASGNLLRPVETAGWCWQEGKRLAHTVHAALAGQLTTQENSIDVITQNPLIKYAVPQRLSLPMAESGAKHIQLRVSVPTRGRLIARSESTLLWSGRINTLPERRVLLPIHCLDNIALNAPLEIDIEIYGTSHQ